MQRSFMVRKSFLFTCSLSLLLSISVKAYSPKYPFPADFVVNAVKYELDGCPAIAFNLINNGFLSVDSLEIKLFFDTSGLDSNLISNLAGRLNILVLYDERGFQSFVDSLSTIKINTEKTCPQKYSFNSNTGKYVWFYPLKLDNISLSTGQRLRIDLVWNKRVPFPPYEDLMNEKPDYIPGDKDWSWGPKSLYSGSPANFNGIINGQREDVDTKVLELNPYITIYRNGKLIWGLPPDWKKIYGENFGAIPDPVSDPMPYAKIAVPFSEYEDQLVRDSANLKISRVRVNQAGYRPEDKKYFYYVADGSASTFKVIDISGKDAGSGTLSSTALTDSGRFHIKASNNCILVAGGDTRYILDGPVISGTIYEGLLPDLVPGKYKVVVGTDTSSPFVVNKLLYNWVGEAVLKFFGASRCGDTHSWFHKPCHLLDPIKGGWHDAGDHLKEGVTQGYTAAVLGLCAAVFNDKDQDVYNEVQSKTTVTDGIPDILYEAKHGADYILQSYEKAGGQVANMITSVGNFSKDHMYWGPPEYQENMSAARGGAPREARNEVGANILGEFAADLAFVSKFYKTYDSAYSDKCLEAARNIYEFIKLRPDSISNSPAYNGSTSANDDIAFAAMALTWATVEKKYLNDLCYDKTIGKMASTAYWYSYEGGWFTYKNPVFCHNVSNTGWASTHVYVLWGFYRLILNDKQICTSLGITDTERLKLIEKTAYHLIFNLSSISDIGDQVINVPDAKMWIPAIVKYKLPWFTMHTQMEWMWNGYQAGNITEMYMYYDIASRLQGVALPNTPTTTDWKTGTIKDILVRQLDYMLGVNPWDISMIYGIGAKNLNHPHYRASNPEVKNTQIVYNYRHLTGALASGYSPISGLYNESAVDYLHSEFSIASTANLLVPVFGLSSTEKVTGKSSYHNINTFHENNDFKIIQLGAGNGFCIKSEKPVMSAVVYKLSGQVIARCNSPSGSVQTIRFGAQKAMRFSDGLYFVKLNFQSGGVKIKKVNLFR